ncbi:MAG: methyltransferase domain-containing protein [Pyrinomonadaceae bacterium]|nr:methyltransferase domain-containing protein [Pyrinomonadaceae bacterium]
MSDYVLGSSDEEIERLAYQNEVWSHETTGLWESAGIGIGTRVADFGCGPGFCTKALARIVGSKGHVYAVDSSEKFAAVVKSETAGASNITFYRSDVCKTPIDDDSVDAVFARWLFCFMGRPEDLVEEVSRVLVPGGKLVVFDYFNYLASNVYPQRPAITSIFDAFTQDVESHGGSWDIGGELTGMLAKSGFEIEFLTPITRIGKPGSRVWRWVQYYAEVTLPRLIESGIWTEEQKLDFEKAWSEAAKDPASFIFTPPMIGIVATLTIDH